MWNTGLLIIKSSTNINEEDKVYVCYSQMQTFFHDKTIVV